MRNYQVVRQINGLYRVESKAEDGTGLRVELSENGNRQHATASDAIVVAKDLQLDEYERPNPPIERVVWSSVGVNPAQPPPPPRP